MLPSSGRWEPEHSIIKMRLNHSTTWFFNCGVILTHYNYIAFLSSPPWKKQHEWPKQFSDHFFFHWHYSPLWALACRTISFHFSLFAINSLHLLTPSTWRSLSTSLFHLFLDLPLLLDPFQFLSENLFVSYPPPFSLGDLISLSFALLSILLYFLLFSSLLALDSFDFSISRFHI